MLYYGQHVASRTTSEPTGPNASKTSATCGQAHLQRVDFDGEKWFLYSYARDVGSNLRLDSGFLPRAGFSQMFHEFGYRIRPQQQGGWYVEMKPEVFVSAIRTRQGKIDEAFTDASFQLLLPRAIFAQTFYSFSRDHFAGKDLSYRYLGLDGSAAPYRRWSVGWSVRLGGASYFGDEPQVGRGGVNSTVGLTIRPTTRLATETLQIHSSLRSQFGGALLFNQNIWRERTTYQFNRFWSIRSITEYNAARGRLGISQLLTYLPSPNTALYVGYNDLLANPVRFGRSGSMDEMLAGWNRQRQVFFIKLTYNLRM